MTFLRKITSKYAASLFSIFSLAIGYFLFAGQSVPDTYDLLASPLIWAIYAIYLIIASFIIDSLLVKFNAATKKNYVSAYTVVGVFIWLIYFFPIALESIGGYVYFIFYFSILTVFPFLLFYAMDRFIHDSWKRIGILGISSVVILLYLLMVSPSITKGFESEYGDNYYFAQFERLNGEKKIDISVEANKVYLIEVDWNIENDRRYGISVSRNVYDIGDLKPVDDWKYEYTAHEAGTIQFTIDGVDIKGNVKMSWEEIEN